MKQDVITDEIHPYFLYEHATQGQRFWNLFMITLNAFSLSYITGMAVGKIGF